MKSYFTDLTTAVIVISVLGTPVVGAQEPAAAPIQATRPDVPPANPNAFPDVVARVKGQDITKARLMEEAAGARAQLAQMGTETILSVEFYRIALDQIIAGMLMSEAATEKGIAATDEEVQARLDAARKQFPTENDFRQALAAQNQTLEQLTADFRTEISTRKYIEAEIVPTVEVTEEELQQLYEQNLESMREPDMVKVRHILIHVTEATTPQGKEASRQIALDVRSRIEAGEDFATLAAQISDDNSTKDKGGELPWLERGSMPPDFEIAVFALETGQTSGVLTSPVGFHIIQSIDQRPARIVPYEEARSAIERVAKQQVLQIRIREVTEELKTANGVEVFL